MKLERHSKIVELIGKYEIDTQEELARRLREAGFTVTQATVSRDIRELKLTKVAMDNGRQRYTVMQSVDSHAHSAGRLCLDGPGAEHPRAEDGLRDGHGGRRGT